jgi:hypothetical protein
VTLWDTRDLPLIEVLADVDGQPQASVKGMARSVGIDPKEAWTALKTLRDANYVTWTKLSRAKRARSPSRFREYSNEGGEH